MPEEKMRKFTCILIDDDPWALAGIQRSLPLQEMGFNLIGQFSNYQDAMRFITEQEPDLVVSDVCLGGSNGLDLIENCRQQNLPCKFIVVSGYSDFEYARRAIRSDVSTYLLKPVDMAEGREALRKVRNSLEQKPMSYEFQMNTIEQIRTYIRENYQTNLTLEDVANHFHMNRTYLSEMFREKFGINFVQYKNEVRIEHAKMLLLDTQKPVSEISSLCGFDNISYFAMVFRQFTGKTPKEYRKEG